MMKKMGVKISLDCPIKDIEAVIFGTKVGTGAFFNAYRRYSVQPKQTKPKEKYLKISDWGSASQTRRT